VNFRDLRHRQTGVDHLLDAPRALSVAQVALLVVGDHLVHDAVDRLGGGICCRRGEDVDRNRGQTDFARRDGSTLPVADLHHAVVAANRGDGHQHTVFVFSRTVAESHE